MLFPLMVSSQPSITSLSQFPEVESFNRLLVVDDEPLVRQMLAEYLSRHQFTTYMAENVDDAKELLRNQSVDLILSDVNMPGPSGVTLHQYCKEHYPDTHFVLMTGFTNEPIDDSILVLSKPMRMPVLLKQIQQIIHRTKLEA